MEERERKPVDGVPVARPRKGSRRQVPPRDVELRLPEEVVALTEAAEEVEPALVDEAGLLRGVVALAAQTLLPPAQDVLRLAADGDEPEVVEAREQHGRLLRLRVSTVER